MISDLQLADPVGPDPTPGPYYVGVAFSNPRNLGINRLVGTDTDGDEVEETILEVLPCEDKPGQQQADAEFAVRAMNAYPRLVKVLLFVYEEADHIEKTRSPNPVVVAMHDARAIKTMIRSTFSDLNLLAK